jgi:hypothetical protein
MVSISLYRHDRLLFPSAVAKGPKKTKKIGHGVQGFTAHLDIDDQASRSSDFCPKHDFIFGPAMIWCFQVRFQWVNWRRFTVWKKSCVSYTSGRIFTCHLTLVPSSVPIPKSNKIETWMWQFTKVAVCFTLTHTYLGVSKNSFTMVYPPNGNSFLGW